MPQWPECTTAALCKYTPPAGQLIDGVTYSWHAWTFDNNTAWRRPLWTRAFTVRLGLGDQPQYPYDDAGGVRVNLANGNAVVHAASPSFPTVGGPVGLTYTYNSQAPPAPGLTGSYYLNNTGVDGAPVYPAVIDGKTPVVVRRDSAVNFWWGGTSPGGPLGSTDYMVRWTGSVTIPNDGRPTQNYWFGATSNDGVKIKVNNGRPRSVAFGPSW